MVIMDMHNIILVASLLCIHVPQGKIKLKYPIIRIESMCIVTSFKKNVFVKRMLCKLKKKAFRQYNNV